MSVPAVARPQSRRLNPVLRLFSHFALTWAFVKAPDPQIVNGPSLWPVLSRSAMTMLLEGEGGHGTTKTAPVPCRKYSLVRVGKRAGWRVMILISYFLVQEDYISDHCGESQGLSCIWASAHLRKLFRFLLIKNLWVSSSFIFLLHPSIRYLLWNSNYNNGDESIPRLIPAHCLSGLLLCHHGGVCFRVWLCRDTFLQTQ